MPCLCLGEVDDHADGALGAADGADFDVADDQAAGVDDAVDDVVDDDKEVITINSNVNNSVINTSSLIISNAKISSIKSTIRMIVNR